MSVDIAQELPKILKEALFFLNKYKTGMFSQQIPSYQKASEILKNSNSSATAVYLACQRILGSNEFEAWEPESIWLELKDVDDIDLSLENRSKLLAVNTLILGEAFYWDAAVYENTVLAFNNIPTAPDVIQEASPGEMSWGVFEAELLSQFAGHNAEFDYEPTRYTAASLHRAGLLLAPELLVFAQEDLDKLNRSENDTNKKSLIEQVSEQWAQTNKNKLEDLVLDETPQDVQIGHLATISMYVGKRIDQLRKEISSL